MTLAELKRSGWQRSRFNKLLPVNETSTDASVTQTDQADFKATVKPLLEQYCYDCHGPEAKEGNVRVSALDPDLVHGSDTDWWTEIFAVVTKGEMPPPADIDMPASDRRQIVDWLSNELQNASLVRRKSATHSGFRRLTRYETNYALQDLLGLPWDFAKDLPPEPQSEEGFQNSSELLHLSVTQFETYYRLARQALERATVSGERPQTLFWGISMAAAAEREWPKQAAQVEKLKKDLAAEPEKLQTELNLLEESFRRSYDSAYYRELSSGRTSLVEWSYPEARYAFSPTDVRPQFPAKFDCVAILPATRRQQLVLELGNQLPDEGTMRVTVRASRLNGAESRFPSLQLFFGWQASNEGRALLRVSDEDVAVTATPDAPELIQWEIPLGEIYPRNSVRTTSPMGATPSPSEYIRIVNSSASESDVQVDYVLVEAPVFDEWPPRSHQAIFDVQAAGEDESLRAREILQHFMTRAWRRPLQPQELDKKLDLFATMRPDCESFEEAMVEVLATILTSPSFLYVGHFSGTSEADTTGEGTPVIDSYQLANRLALFLWSSLPDEELLTLAESGQLASTAVLDAQVQRMLADPRSRRFSKHFVNQWLNLELLEFVNLERQINGFDPLLKESMQQEPVALFEEILEHNASVLDFLHADYAVVNERLAQHYDLEGIYGNHFRRVSLDGEFRRGGLLTQAGVLAMNSDWPDSHPLKRAIWLLERLLADPPPPPPPAVPQIDLADPEIAKMTLKERIEDHRNQAACRSCHVKIDPWGIAFENFDALGKWREEIRGKPVDASSELFNHQTIDGMLGLKRYLLENRQDQFVQAMVEKLSTYALGRPLGFADRAPIEAITAEVRREGDGLQTMITKIVMSDLFRSP